MTSSILVKIDVKTLLKRRDTRYVAPFIVWKLQQAGVPMMDWEAGTRHRLKDLCMSGQVMQVVASGPHSQASGGVETTGLLRYFWMTGNPNNAELFRELRRILAEQDGRTDPPHPVA